MEAYQELKSIFEKMNRLQHLCRLGEWDLKVMMPPKGIEARGAALSELRGIIHEMLANPKVEKLLAQARAATESMEDADKANLREMTRMYRIETCLPADIVTRKAKLAASAQQKWKECKERNDVASWLPTLQELVELAREEAALLCRFKENENEEATTGDNNDNNRRCGLYDGLLNRSEPGMTTARLDEIYANIKSWLPDLYREVIANRKDMCSNIIPIKGPLDEAKQVELGRRLIATWEFDFEAGRFDKSAHPFGGMVKEDVRLTAFYSPDEYVKGILSTVHETGHAKYEQNCGPREMLGQPVCMARSGGIHETQSLLYERMIMKSRQFAEYLLPMLIDTFGEQPALTLDNVIKTFQLVKPSYIRPLADELANALHVILRYEIERDLMDGRMEAADVPRVWNEKMEAYIGLSTEGRDDLGCLQDIHWASGYFGSFPAYSIGAIGAAQIMAAIRRDIGDATVDECIRTGNMRPIMDRQKEMIWSRGCLDATGDELMAKATGEPLNPKYLRQHLEQRYLHGK